MTGAATGMQKCVQENLQRLQRRSQSWLPDVLAKACEKICDARDVPPLDPRATNRLDEAMDRLLASGAERIAARDHVVLAYNLAEAHASLPSKSLLNTLSMLAPLLECWRRRLGTRGSYRQVWRGALLSLFRGAPTDAGFDATRHFLVDTLIVLQAGKHRPVWLDGLTKHPRLLTEKPVDGYVLDWLEGRREDINQLRDLVDLPPNSWFWTSLIAAILDACCKTTNDAVFDERWPVVLGVIDDHPSCRDLVLSRILARYAKKRVVTRRDDLLQVSLDAWGSPQLGIDVIGRWSDTSDEARSMVCGWLAEEDLEDFASVCKGDPMVDGRRLAYWLRFKKQISFSRIVLGSAICDARDAGSREFISRKKERLAYLRGTPNNNAIILHIRDWWFVEFSEKGNACYPYSDECKPFDVTHKDLSVVPELRNMVAMENSGGERLIHRDTTEGLWESIRFDRFLARNGIWPDTVNRDSRGSTLSSSASTKPVVVERPQASLPSAARQRVVSGKKSPSPVSHPRDISSLNLSQTLLGLLKPFAPRIVDNRPKGGALWIELSRTPDSALQKAMERYRFRYAKGRGFYKQ